MAIKKVENPKLRFNLQLLASPNEEGETVEELRKKLSDANDKIKVLEIENEKLSDKEKTWEEEKKTIIEEQKKIKDLNHDLFLKVVQHKTEQKEEKKEKKVEEKPKFENILNDIFN